MRDKDNLVCAVFFCSCVLAICPMAIALYALSTHRKWTEITFNFLYENILRQRFTAAMNRTVILFWTYGHRTRRIVFSSFFFASNPFQSPSFDLPHIWSLNDLLVFYSFHFGASLRSIKELPKWENEILMIENAVRTNSNKEREVKNAKKVVNKISSSKSINDRLPVF